MNCFSQKCFLRKASDAIKTTSIIRACFERSGIEKCNIVTSRVFIHRVASAFRRMKGLNNWVQAKLRFVWWLETLPMNPIASLHHRSVLRSLPMTPSMAISPNTIRLARQMNVPANMLKILQLLCLLQHSVCNSIRIQTGTNGKKYLNVW